jgi:hypothetical protein
MEEENCESPCLGPQDPNLVESSPLPATPHSRSGKARGRGGRAHSCSHWARAPLVFAHPLSQSAPHLLLISAALRASSAVVQTGPSARSRPFPRTHSTPPQCIESLNPCCCIHATVLMRRSRRSRRRSAAPLPSLTLPSLPGPSPSDPI